MPIGSPSSAPVSHRLAPTVSPSIQSPYQMYEITAYGVPGLGNRPTREASEHCDGEIDHSSLVGSVQPLLRGLMLRTRRRVRDSPRI